MMLRRMRKKEEKYFCLFKKIEQKPAEKMAMIIRKDLIAKNYKT